MATKYSVCFLRFVAYLIMVAGLVLPLWHVGASPDQQDTLPELVYGQTVDDRIDEAQPSAFYAFEATADDVITIAMVVTEGELDPFIVLNTSDRTPLATDDNSGGDRNARLTFVIPATGRYIIQATHAGGVPPEGGGTFSLNLTAAVEDVPVSTPEATTAPTESAHIARLEAGTTQQDTLTRQATLRYYWFEAQFGDQVTVTPDPAGDFQPLYVLYSATFNELDRASAAEPLQASIPESGIYFLSVSLPEPSSTGGDYTFTFDRTINPATAENIIDIAYGETQQGTIDSAISAVTYRFQGSEGDTVTITMSRTDGDLDSYLYLLDETGQLMFEDNDSGGGNGDARITYILPAGGTYLIVATRLGQAQGPTSGSYRLDLQSDALSVGAEAPPDGLEPTLPAEYATLPQVTYGETVNGEISNASFMDFYVFLGKAGDAVTIEMQSGNPDDLNGLDPFLILLDANRIPLAENDDIVDGVERDARIEITLPETAYYAIVATRFDQDAGVSSGPYTLTLSGPGSLVPSADVPLPEASIVLVRLDPTRLTSGSPQQAAFRDGADLYAFSASEDTRVDITVTSDPGVDAVLILADENLNEVAFSSTGTLTGITVPKSGQYLVMVAPRFGPVDSLGGGYILALTQTGAAVEAETPAMPRTLTYGDTVNGVIDDENVSQIYTFSGSEGERIRITMEATPDSDLDCYLELQDSDGEVIDANDDIDPGVIRDSQIVVNLPRDGTYTVIASRYVGPDAPTTSGNYRLSLELLAQDAAEGVSSITVPIRYGETKVGEINDDQYLLFYVFDGTAGDSVTISVDHLSGNLDSVLHLYQSENDNWVLFASNDDSPTGGTYAPLLSDITLPGTGKYLIAISRYGMEREDSFGTFALTLTLEAPAE